MFPPAEGGGEGLAKWAGTRFLGRIPMFTAVEQAGEKGECVINQGGNASIVISKIVNGRGKGRGNEWQRSYRWLVISICFCFQTHGDFGSEGAGYPFVSQSTCENLVVAII